jgi:hypothetical protein
MAWRCGVSVQPAAPKAAAGKAAPKAAAGKVAPKGAGAKAAPKAPKAKAAGKAPPAKAAAAAPKTKGTRLRVRCSCVGSEGSGWKGWMPFLALFFYVCVLCRYHGPLFCAGSNAESDVNRERERKEGECVRSEHEWMNE